MDRTSNQVKNRSDNRAIHLRPIEGKDTLNSVGGVDRRLFTGEAKLIAKKVPGGNMWAVVADGGLLPPQLKQTFTSFNKLMSYLTEYYARRNIQIIDVEDIFET